MKILCAGDLHIGRRPSRLPDRIDCGPLSCASAWAAIVDRAIAERVDLVALSGAAVDEANRFYEAIGPLESGVRRLAASGIRTVAVAGNHDHDVLPSLARSLPAEDFRLIGPRGKWERVTIERDGRPALHVDGWSFPERRHRADPLLGYAPEAAGDTPVLRLLHADLDQPGSDYAPVRLADLRRHQGGFWLLGHIHAPRHDAPAGAAAVLYPGSPQPMDPGEPGSHGVWLVEVSGGRFAARAVPLASVRYETVQVDVSGVTDEMELGGRVSDAARGALLECVAGECGPLRYLCLRLELFGRTPMHAYIRRHADQLAEGLELEHHGVRAVVERVVPAARPLRDLETLSRAEGAPGVLARLISDIETGRNEAELLQRAIRAAGEAAGAPAYAILPADEAAAAADPDRIRELVIEQASTLLDTVLAQKETG